MSQVAQRWASVNRWQSDADSLRTYSASIGAGTFVLNALAMIAGLMLLAEKNNTGVAWTIIFAASSGICFGLLIWKTGACLADLVEIGAEIVHQSTKTL